MKRIFTSLLILFTSHFSFSQWNSNPAVNNPITIAANRQSLSRSVSDGAGGAIITWMDYDGTNNIYKIYAQRITANGVTKWATNGVAVCASTGAQKFPQIISDKRGGAIIMWLDYRGIDGLYAQRINSNGIPQWTLNGVLVTTEIQLDQITFTPLADMTVDGNGGAIMTWADGRDIANGNFLYAQHIDANGATRWANNGLIICFRPGVTDPTIVSDNKDGAFIAFENYSGDYPNSRSDIYAQRINSLGVAKWGNYGALVCNAPENQILPEIISDGNVGAIIVWQDKRNTFNTNSNLYAQRVNGKGAPLWNVNGIAVSPITNVENIQQLKQKLISDSSGNAIICWSEDYPSGIRYNVFAQRITKAGVLKWGTAGIQISPENYVGLPSPQLVTDGKDGAIITWDGTLAANNFTDIAAQRINAQGIIKWTANGVPVCTALDNQYEPQIVTDTTGKTIICWTDNRNNGSVNTSDIFASKLNPNGNLSSLAEPLNAINISAEKINSETSSRINISPNPATSFINIRYTSKKEITSFSIYDVQGKLLKQQMIKNELPAKINVSDLIPGTYFIYLNDGITTQKEKFVKQ